VSDESSDRESPQVAELGHVGIRCHDLDAQVGFYTEVLGLTITDYDRELGMCFLSSRPALEHHELLLARGRDVPTDARLLQQISFRCASLRDVVAFHRKFLATGTRIDMVANHGNAVGVYFYDPEGNRVEVYWRTGLVAHQPFVKYIDLEATEEVIMQEVAAAVRAFGDAGFTEEEYVAWTEGQTQGTEAKGLQQ
jgi:catechol 2,3-dioxygenase-like lactoylglutathione lyase family enzyme